MGADSYTCQRRGLLVRPVRRRDPAGMDIHVEQRFKHHHALRGERLPMPAQALQVVVETGVRQTWFSSFPVACEAVRAFRLASAGGD